MSAAFRNFILTLVIMLAVFGYLAVKALPDIEDAVFGGDESQVSEEASETINVSKISEQSSTGETSEPEVKEEFDSFNCILATRNSVGDVCSLLYVGISEENRTYVVCRIPVDMTIDVDGVPKKLHTLIGLNSNDYLLRKISPLIGKDVKYYIACDGKTYKSLPAFAAKKSAQYNIDLTYPVRYLDPDFAGVVTDDPPDEYYITIPAGRVTLTDQNAAQILDSEKEGDTSGYTFQESMGLSLFRQTVSLTGVGDNVSLLDMLRSSVSTNVPVAEMLKYAALLFSYNDYTVININYPTMQSYANPDIKTPNWSSGINQINTAEAGK